jgi:hypothetical protein
MRFHPFGDKPLPSLGRPDLQRLVDDALEENLFLEYKSQLELRQVSREVTAFANTEGGGTVVVGIEEKNRAATNIVGIPSEVGLVEKIVQSLRSNVAPVPAFDIHVLGVSDSKVAVVIAVPPGTQPPYVWLPRGQILIRTQATTEPIRLADRDALDRLYALGIKGRRWALDQLSGLEGLPVDQYRVQAVTIPAVADGLGEYVRLYRESFMDRLVRSTPFPYERGIQHERQIKTFGMETGRVTVGAADDFDAHTVVTGVETTGMTTTDWIGDAFHLSYDTAKLMPKQVLPYHREVVEDMLGHRGDVVMFLQGQIEESASKASRFRFHRGPLSIAELENADFHEVLVREIKRSLGLRAYEPEE